MAYLIQGTLLVQEKPEVYLGKFAQVRKGEKQLLGVPARGSFRWVVDSGKVANRLNKLFGLELQLVEDEEKAAELCSRKSMGVLESRLLTPKEGWEDYLTTRFGETKDATLIGGTLQVWSANSIPTPWVYFLSVDELVGAYSFEGGDEEFRRLATEGKRVVGGLITSVYDLRVTYQDAENTATFARRRDILFYFGPGAGLTMLINSRAMGKE